MYLREHFNGVYRSDVYFLCKTLVEVAWRVVVEVTRRVERMVVERCKDCEGWLL